MFTIFNTIIGCRYIIENSALIQFVIKSKFPELYTTNSTSNFDYQTTIYCYILKL